MASPSSILAPDNASVATELAADTFAALASMHPTVRQKLLYVNCNAGFSPGETQFLLGPLDDQYSATALARREPWEGEVREPSECDCEAALRQEQAAHVSGLVRGAAGAGRRLAGLWITPGTSRGLIAPLLESGAIRFPELPWNRRIPPEAKPMPARIGMTASFRTVAVFPVEGRPLEMKIHAPPEAKAVVRGRTANLLARLKRRCVMEWLFGVDRAFVGGTLTTLDALHSLWASQTVARAAEASGGEFGVLRETAAGIDRNGHGFIVRDPLPYPAPTSAVQTIPCLSLLGNRRRRQLDLLALLSCSSGLAPARIAIEIGRRYLYVWHQLLFQHRLILFMPHAQNAFIELDASNRLGRLVVKDMRDVDFWPSYREYTCRSTRLLGIDRHYLNYEMAVHPFYFDVRWSRDPAVNLAAGVFNYSFQMLRNYIFRGFQLALLALDRRQAEIAVAGFADSLDELAHDGGHVPLADMPAASEAGDWIAGRFHHAWRRLRGQWLELALSS
jgi:hypothetical protein